MKYRILAGLMMATIAADAVAHSRAEDTTPASGATVKAVEVIEMRFDDPMRVIAITLTGPAGEVEIERETGMDAAMTFRALPPAGLPAGDYAVDWRGLSADGHPMQGSFGFSLAD